MYWDVMRRHLSCLGDAWKGLAALSRREAYDCLVAKQGKYHYEEGGRWIRVKVLYDISDTFGMTVTLHSYEAHRVPKFKPQIQDTWGPLVQSVLAKGPMMGIENSSSSSGSSGRK